MWKALVFVALFAQVAMGLDLLRATRQLFGITRGGGADTICKHEPIDLGIVLDSSSSIRQSDFDKGLKFLQDFLGQFKIGSGHNDVRVSLISYGRGIYPDQGFDLDTYDSNQAVEAAVGRIKHKFGLRTDTGAAIEYMDKTQMKPGVRRSYAEQIAIVLTDGNSQDWRKTRSASAAARKSGIKMFAVGVGENVRDEELKGIAGDDSRVIRVKNYGKLQDIIKKLANETCIRKPRPATTPSPATVCGDKRPGDINFVFSPADLGQEGTLWVTDFITLVVDNEDMETGFRYGTVTGSCPEDAGFKLNAYDNARDLKDRIREYERYRTSELAHRALREGYTSQNGGRPNSKDVAVIVIPEDFDVEELQGTISEMLEKGIQVFIADPFETEIEFAGTHRLEGPGSRQASYSFVSALCS